MAIKFGTDGWRAIIGDEFTFANMDIAVQAICDVLHEKGQTKKGVAVCYDFRFLAEAFARRACEVLAGNGIRAILTSEADATPVLSLYIEREKLDLGLNLTASHNSGDYLGLKIKENFGGSAAPEFTAAVEARLGKTPVKKITLEAAKEQGLFEERSFNEQYFAKLRSLVDLDAIKNAGLTIVADAMHGVAQTRLAELLRGGATQVVTIRSRRDPLFGGNAPEPKEDCLQQLIREVKHYRAALGVATDGDADRLGIIRPSGEFLPPPLIMALLANYLLKDRKLTGALAITYANTQFIRQIAEKHGQKYYEKPVGFKYIAEIMQREPFLIGGEESGGIALQGFIPERDGILIILYFLEMLAKTGKTVDQLLQELYAEYGERYFRRIDLKVDPAKGLALAASIAEKQPADLFSARSRIEALDGVKFFLPDGAWILIRQSGTEPKMRIYAEGRTPAQVESLLEEARKYVMSKL
jgi:phosphomannomutase